MKKFLSILLAAMMLMSLIACGDKAAVTDADETATSASGEKIVLHYLDAAAYGVDEFDAMVEQFEAENPNIDVQVEHIANDINTQLAAKLNSNQLPDIFATNTGNETVRYSEYAYDFTGNPLLDKLKDSALATSNHTDGKVLSVPMSFETMGMLYNKDVFEKNGITELPKTISELRAVCEKLKANGQTAFAVAAKESWVLNQLSTHFMVPQDPDPEKVAKGLLDGTYTMDTLKNFSGLYDVLDLMIEYGPDKPLEYDWEMSETALVNGDCAMIQMGDWCYQALKSFNPDANVGMMLVPTSENPDEAFLQNNVSWQLNVNKNSKHVDAAVKFVDYILTSKPGVEWFMRYHGSVPSAKETYGFENVNTLASSAAEYADQTVRMLQHSEPTEVMNGVGPELQAYMLGQTTKEKSIAAIQALWDSVAE